MSEVADTMSTARSYYTAIRLSNGSVLAAGGDDYNHEYSYIPSAELYNPATGGWSYTESMISERYSYAAIPLLDNTVLFIGGATDRKGLASVELYNPSTGR